MPQVFVMGGSGSIGTALVKELIATSHKVSALCRSDVSAATLRALGAVPVQGDLTRPEYWMAKAISHDAIIHVASTFDDDMGNVDGRVVSELIDHASARGAPIRVLYTGGCWLYGETGDEVASEDHPFDPLPAFRWMVDHSEMLLNASNISAAIVHPAMVYHESGGVFEDILASLRGEKPVEIWGSPSTRWPLIERRDLARAYCNLLDRTDLSGHINAVAQEGVRVGDVVSALCAQFSQPYDPATLGVDEVVAKFGAWATGPTLDQQMTAAKLKAATSWAPRVVDFRTLDFMGIEVGGRP